jgi:elongation factor G
VSTSVPVEQGIKEALENGVLAGYPMVDVKVELVYGSYHDVDSSKWRSRSPARWHSRKRRARAADHPRADDEGRGRLPRAYMGDVLGDLSRAAARSAA